jgi:hypothetical protein
MPRPQNMAGPPKTGGLHGKALYAHPSPGLP